MRCRQWELESCYVHSPKWRGPQRGYQEKTCMSVDPFNLVPREQNVIDQES